jgi:hypothetical protein
MVVKDHVSMEVSFAVVGRPHANRFRKAERSLHTLGFFGEFDQSYDRVRRKHDFGERRSKLLDDDARPDCGLLRGGRTINLRRERRFPDGGESGRIRPSLMAERLKSDISRTSGCSKADISLADEVSKPGLLAWAEAAWHVELVLPTGPSANYPMSSI